MFQERAERQKQKPLKRTGPQGLVHGFNTPFSSIFLNLEGIGFRERKEVKFWIDS